MLAANAPVNCIPGLSQRALIMTYRDQVFRFPCGGYSAGDGAPSSSGPRAPKGLNRGLLTKTVGIPVVLLCCVLFAGCAGGTGLYGERCGGVDGQWATWDGFLRTTGKMRVIRLASADVPPFVSQFNATYDTTLRAEDVYFAYRPHDRTWLITFVNGPCVQMSARIPSGEARRLMGVSEPSI